MEILTSTIELIAAIQLLAGLARHCSLGIALNDLQSSLANCGHNADTFLRLGAASIRDSRMRTTDLRRSRAAGGTAPGFFMCNMRYLNRPGFMEPRRLAAQLGDLEITAN